MLVDPLLGGHMPATLLFPIVKRSFECQALVRWLVPADLPLRGGGGMTIDILRIMASTSRLSSFDKLVEYFLISARKRISSSESSPRTLRVSRSCGVSVPGKKSARLISMASAIFASVSRDGTVWPFSTRER